MDVSKIEDANANAVVCKVEARTRRRTRPASFGLVGKSGDSGPVSRIITWTIRYLLTPALALRILDLKSSQSIASY